MVGKRNLSLLPLPGKEIVSPFLGGLCRCCLTTCFLLGFVTVNCHDAEMMSSLVPVRAGSVTV